MRAVIEGLLFIAGDEGISIEKLKESLQVSNEELQKDIDLLKEEYHKPERGICLEKLGDTIKLVTKKEHTEYYENYFSFDNDSTLSSASLEVLAIIAYNEPVTRSMVDEIRGVSSAHILRKLLAKNLIEVTGKSDLPGRPNLYSTTETFLEYFGISAVTDLPKIEIEETEEERELYTSKYKEENE